MPKIVLGNRPKSFKRVVKVPLHDDPDGFIEVSYKYRTLTEFGAFIDDYSKQVEAKIQAEGDARDAARKAAEEKGETYEEQVPTNEELRKKQAQASAEYLALIMDGWNLDVEFGAEALYQLCDEVPAAAAQIVNDYRIAITEGRLGN